MLLKCTGIEMEESRLGYGPFDRFREMAPMLGVPPDLWNDFLNALNKLANVQMPEFAGLKELSGIQDGAPVGTISAKDGIGNIRLSVSNESLNVRLLLSVVEGSPNLVDLRLVDGGG